MHQRHAAGSALVGLLLIVTQGAGGAPWLTYALMSAVAGVCGYYAIGKPGYIALLTVITMCIVAGHGNNTLDTGLWRVLDVLIGNVIALAFSFAPPLHATYSWRYPLADNLRECARIYGQVASGRHDNESAKAGIFRRLGDRLVRLRIPDAFRRQGNQRACCPARTHPAAAPRDAERAGNDVGRHGTLWRTTPGVRPVHGTWRGGVRDAVDGGPCTAFWRRGRNRSIADALSLTGPVMEGGDGAAAAPLAPE